MGDSSVKDDSKRIGSLNGPWSVLLRLSLATYPILLLALFSFFTWVVVQIHQLEIWRATTTSNRFTINDYIAAKTQIDDRINGVDKRLIVLESKMDSIATNANNAAAMSTRNNELLQKMIQQ